MAPWTENKPVAQVGLKEMIYLLNNKKVEKRNKMSKVMGGGKLV